MGVTVWVRRLAWATLAACVICFNILVHDTMTRVGCVRALLC